MNSIHSLAITTLLLSLQIPPLSSIFPHFSDKSGQHYDSYNFYLVVDQVMGVLHAANNFFESTKPWELKSSATPQPAASQANITKEPQQNIENGRKLETIIMLTMETLRVCAIILQPIIPGFSEKLLDKLNVDQDERCWLHTVSKVGNEGTQLDNANVWRERSLGSGATVLFQRIVSDTDKTKKLKKVSKT